MTGKKTSTMRATQPSRSHFYYRIFLLFVVIAISLLIFIIREKAQDYAAFGYPGIFLIALLANATVFLPAPGVAIVFSMGSVFNPWAVALAAGTGAALGEVTGYLAGFSGQIFAERNKTYQRVLPMIQKFGGWAILLLSAIPNPFFDLAGIAAGACKIPVFRFLLFCWFGQIIKMSAFAFAGYYSVDWFSKWI
jgi:membrane protein DedA with SNARE-associated domain